MTTEEQRPPPTVSQETMKKIMWLYRTRTCPLNKRGNCNHGDRCFDSHSVHPERRAPKQNEYNDWHPSTMKCTSNADESCKYGRACYFAHNDFEVKYHPTMYKTLACEEFEKSGYCKLGMICPFYHYADEQRKIEKETLSADCKSDGVSRKAPPPQEFSDGELKRGSNIDTKLTSKVLQNGQKKAPNQQQQQLTQQQLNGNANNNKQHIINKENNHNVLSSETNLILPNNDHDDKVNDDSTVNEVEIQLPSSQHDGNDLMLRNDASSMSPFVTEHIEEKWHQSQNSGSVNYNNQSRAEQFVSPQLGHLNRALSTPSSIPSVPSSAQLMPLSNMQMAESLPSNPSRILQSNSNASFRSGISQKSNSSKQQQAMPGIQRSRSSRGNKKQRRKKSRSVASGQSLGSIHGHSHYSNSSKQRQQREEMLKMSIDIVKTYKVTRCPKSKCQDPYCPNYHNWEDRRRSPFSFGYSEIACSRIFDEKTKKFTDNCYGCPMNESCEFAHNYLEIWYHPNVFHTKMCPIMKYQKNCPWGFKCSHYHKKSQKQRKPLTCVLTTHTQPQNGMNVLGAPPNLAQHGVVGINGPHRPPLTHQRSKQSPSVMSSEIGSPYSAVSSLESTQHINNGHGVRNGVVSPHSFAQHNGHVNGVQYLSSSSPYKQS